MPLAIIQAAANVKIVSLVHKSLQLQVLRMKLLQASGKVACYVVD